MYRSTAAERRPPRTFPSPFSTGTAQALGEHGERPAPGGHRRAGLAELGCHSAAPQPDSSCPVPSCPRGPSPALGAERSGPRREGEEGGGTAAARPFHTTQTPAASPARFPNAGGSRGVVRPGPQRAEGARRHHQPVPPPASPERSQADADPGACGRSRPSGPASARTRRTGPSRRERGRRGGDAASTEQPGRFPPLRARHRRHPARRIASRNNSRPALRHRRRPDTHPARAPGSPDTPPSGHTDAHMPIRRDGRTDSTDPRPGAGASPRDSRRRGGRC